MRPRVWSAARRAVQRTRAARPRRHPLRRASLALMGLRLPSRRRARPSRPMRPCLRPAFYLSEARHCAAARWHPRCRSRARPTRCGRRGNSCLGGGFLVNSETRHTVFPQRCNPSTSSEPRPLVAGLGFLAAFFPDAIAPASDVLFLFSQKQQKQKKTRALTAQFDLVCVFFWLSC